jgi:ABC-type transport system involved in multi-copper enzyme maturation permease subunit
VSRARVGAYALWQFRDYLKDRGVPTLIVATLAAYLSLSAIFEPNVREPVLAILRARFDTAEAVQAAWMSYVNFAFLSSTLNALVFVGALFAMNGIVANDRKLGFYRFLFAKPVTPSRYYGQAFLVHWAGFMLVMTLLGLLYGLILSPILTQRLLVGIGLMFVAYSGIAFLLSAAARWDWLSLVAAAVAATLLWRRFEASPHPIARLLYLLPPLHRVNEVYLSVSGTPVVGSASPGGIPWALLVWLTGYGVVCYVAGLVVLRYRRLAII